MIGVKLATAFGILLMIVLVCCKQIPKEQHLTYPVTEEAYFTANAHKYHDENLKKRHGRKRLIRAAANNEYVGGGTKDNRQVIFYLNGNAQIADRNQLNRDVKTDLDSLFGKIKADQIFSKNAGTLDYSPRRGFRLDMQGMVKVQATGNQPYHNLQVQSNVPRAGSTTYATVLVPQNANGLLSNPVVRRAFYDSSNSNSAVRLGIGNKIVQPVIHGRRPA